MNENLFENFPLLPKQASTIAGKVDAATLLVLGVTIFFATLICIIIIYLAVKYRAGSKADRSRSYNLSFLPLEISWTVIPLLISIGLFLFAAKTYFEMYRPPRNAMEIYVVGRQWMWKIQHPNGKREINSLHVPIGVPVRLIMTSEDVIHSFFIPAFRIKQDVLPGRYTMLWFEATRPGRYHLFCAEYCGTQHSGMRGSIFVLKPDEYQQWLDSTRGEGGSMASRGEDLFVQLGCATCHRPGSGARGPQLNNLFGSTVRLRNGSTVVANENYIRESIINPNAKVVEGFETIMPTFTGRINEEQITEIINYLKDLKNQNQPQPGPGKQAAANKTGG